MQRKQYTHKISQTIKKENTTGQETKLIEKPNKQKKVKKIWEAAKLLLNRNQKTNEKLPINNQEAVDAFAENTETTMKTTE